MPAVTGSDFYAPDVPDEEDRDELVLRAASAATGAAGAQAAILRAGPWSAPCAKAARGFVAMRSTGSTLLILASACTVVDATAGALHGQELVGEALAYSL